MDIPINAEVGCVDGPAGKSTYVVIDTVTGQVTQFVVETSVFPRNERVVPVNMIRESTPQRIELRCTKAELEALPPFRELEYQRGEDEEENYEPGQWLFSPAAEPAPAVVPLERENVSDTALALRRGARVEATDGTVGTVADLVVDPVNNQLTHLILHEGGGIFKKRQVTITADQVDHIDDDTVYLKLDKHAVDLLPDVPVQE